MEWSAASTLLTAAMLLVSVITISRLLVKDKTDSTADIAQIKATTTSTAAAIDKMDVKMDALAAKDAELSECVAAAQMTADSAHRRLDDIGAPKDR